MRPAALRKAWRSLRSVEPAGGSSQRTRDQVPACPSCLAGLVTPFQCLAFPDVPDPHRSQAAHAREFGIRRGEGPSRATTSLSPPALFLIRPGSQGVERKPASRGIAFCINTRVARTEKPVVLEFLSHTIQFGLGRRRSTKREGWRFLQRTNPAACARGAAHLCPSRRASRVCPPRAFGAPGVSTSPRGAAGPSEGAGPATQPGSLPSPLEHQAGREL